MRFEIGGLVGDGAVADGVGLVEGVSRERLHEVKDGDGVRFAVAQPAGALNEAAALLLHDFGDLLAHRFAHDVGLPQGVAGELPGDV